MNRMALVSFHWELKEQVGWLSVLVFSSNASHPLLLFNSPAFFLPFKKIPTQDYLLHSGPSHQAKLKERWVRKIVVYLTPLDSATLDGHLLLAPACVLL